MPEHIYKRKPLIQRLESYVDLTLERIDNQGLFEEVKQHRRQKGIAGKIVEQCIFGYSQDPKQEPDLIVVDDGCFIRTELKTTGMRRGKEGNKEIYTAKEPASITAVSIGKIENEAFDDSLFWHKAENLLFLFYEYESRSTVSAYEYKDFHLRGYNFFKFNNEDLIILKNDWQIIHDFLVNIRDNCTSEEAEKEYPNLSTIVNKQTVYLDTAPKYPNNPRFRLRKRVVDLIIQDAFDGTRFKHKDSKLITLPSFYSSYADVINKCIELTNSYKGQTVGQIISRLGISHNVTNKNVAEYIIAAMFGCSNKKLSNIDMFVRFGIKGKSITLSRNKSRTEDTKLYRVNFDDLQESAIYDEDIGEFREKAFEDSELYYFLNDYKFLFAVFQEPSKEAPLADNVFLGFKLLDLSFEEMLCSAKKCWEKARKLILSNELTVEVLKDKHGNPRYTPKTHLPMNAPNWPKSKEYDVFMRGTGSDAAHKKTINGLEMYYQDYWVKGSVLVDKLNTIETLHDNQFGRPPFNYSQESSFSVAAEQMPQYGNVKSYNEDSDNKA